MHCESCGMPMNKPEDHGEADSSCKYCRYCAPDGKLNSREEVREGWITAAMRMDSISREDAEKKIDEIMPQMPAWKK